MRWTMFAVRDMAAEVFLPPFVVRHDVEGQRVFERLCAQGAAGSMMCDFPEQFALYKLGHFDDVSGYVEMLPVLEYVCGGKKYAVGQQVSEQYETHVLEGSESGDQQEQF